MSDRNTKKTRKPRRSWSKSLKRQIVEESNTPGVSVCEVARSYDLDPAQLFAWRKKFGTDLDEPQSSNEEAAFVAVEVDGNVDLAIDPLGAEPSCERFEIAFPNGRHLFVPIDTPVHKLNALIAAVEAAWFLCRQARRYGFRLA